MSFLTKKNIGKNSEIGCRSGNRSSRSARLSITFAALVRARAHREIAVCGLSSLKKEIELRFRDAKSSAFHLLIDAGMEIREEKKEGDRSIMVRKMESGVCTRAPRRPPRNQRGSSGSCSSCRPSGA